MNLQFNNDRRQLQLLGFTLIELLTVIAIFSIILAILLPISTKSFRGLQLSDSARSLTYLMKYIQNRAILDREIFSLKFDPADSHYSVRIIKDGKFEEFKEIKSSLLSNKNLGVDLELESLTIIEDTLARVDKSSIYFYPNGSIDESRLILSNSTNDKIAIETNSSGKINVIKE